MIPDAHLFELMAQQVRDYGLFLLDPRGRIISWNTGARLIKGYEADEIIGKHFSVFYTPEAIARGWPEHELSVAAREGRFEDEDFRVGKDGSRFWANVIITALRDDDGKLVAFSKITRDLSERRAQEEALRHSEERFRLLIEGVVDYAIFMLDPQGVISSWNAGAERIKGFSREEAIGRHFSNFYTDEDIKAGTPWAGLAQARRTGRAEDEGWRIRKNGERFWARVVITALQDGEGRLYGFAKVTQDLSERQRTRELESAAKHVNEFIAMLAHEIRNPLAPIRNAVQVMQRLDPADPRQVAMRETIDRQSEHLSRIADDMLDISRISRGTLVVEKNRVDLADVVSRAVEATQPTIEAALHSLEVNTPTDPIIVDGDVYRLTQVLCNLLNNAARYTPPGGRITLAVLEENGSAVLRVCDNGRGIEADSLDTIFQMFVRGRAPLERVGEGLGVGLALSRSIVELHGGSIEARSEGPGRGSEFTVQLPLSKEAAAVGESAPALASSGLAQRVLIVDDNVDAAHTLDVLLKSLGHETHVVYDGLVALEAVDSFRPDVILLDIGLPGINGYEVAKRVRSRTGPRVRIIAITGWGKEDDRKRSAEAGFDVHLVKPVDELELLRVMESPVVPGTQSLH